MEVEPRGITLPLVYPIVRPFLLDFGFAFSKWSLGDSNP
jgi:hypothetical protein